jgi:hypothetical protein
MTQKAEFRRSRLACSRVSKNLFQVIYIVPAVLYSRYYYYCSFTDKETEAQNGVQGYAIIKYEAGIKIDSRSQ